MGGKVQSTTMTAIDVKKETLDILDMTLTDSTKEKGGIFQTEITQGSKTEANTQELITTADISSTNQNIVQLSIGMTGGTLVLIRSPGEVTGQGPGAALNNCS